jgi:hypothetical protein
MTGESTDQCSFEILYDSLSELRLKAAKALFTRSSPPQRQSFRHLIVLDGISFLLGFQSNALYQ